MRSGLPPLLLVRQEKRSGDLAEDRGRGGKQLYPRKEEQLRRGGSFIRQTVVGATLLLFRTRAAHSDVAQDICIKEWGSSGIQPKSCSVLSGCKDKTGRKSQDGAAVTDHLVVVRQLAVRQRKVFHIFQKKKGGFCCIEFLWPGCHPQSGGLPLADCSSSRSSLRPHGNAERERWEMRQTTEG